MKRSRLLLTALSAAYALLLVGSLAAADVITGRVVGPNGVGVPGVDLDFARPGGGGNAHEMNDGTDANGFFTTTVDNDVWDVFFYPPVPPATTLLTGVRLNVNANGPINLGTITLAQGVSATGTLLGISGIPVAGVKVKVIQNSTGNELLLKGNTSTAFGTFNVAVPAGQSLDFQFLTNAVFGQTLAPRVITQTLSGNFGFGNIQLQTGHHITGTVRRTNGTNVANADIDVYDAITGEKLLTPGDNTTATGTFDVVAAAGGLYDVIVCHPPGVNLVATDVNNLALNANTNLGVMTMRNGVVMSGTIRNRNGVPVPGADVNVYEAGSTVQVTLCNDNANGAGFYSVIVPTGVFDVVFSPPGPHYAFQKDRHDGVNITAAFTLDGRFGGTRVQTANGAPTGGKTLVIPFTGRPGAGHVVPAIDWIGAASSTTGAGHTLSLTGGTPGALATALLGFQHASLGGTEVVRPLLRLTTTLDADGTGWIAVPPLEAALIGRTVLAQFTVEEPGSSRPALSPILGIEVR